MSIGEALTTIILYVRERGDDLPPNITRALKCLDAKDAKLREKREARRNANQCGCGQHQKPRGHACCWVCYHAAPVPLRNHFLALTPHAPEAVKREVFRALIEFSHTRRESLSEEQHQHAESTSV